MNCEQNSQWLLLNIRRRKLMRLIVLVCRKWVREQYLDYWIWDERTHALGVCCGQTIIITIVWHKTFFRVFSPDSREIIPCMIMLVLNYWVMFFQILSRFNNSTTAPVGHFEMEISQCDAFITGHNMYLCTLVWLQRWVRDPQPDSCPKLWSDDDDS